MNSVCYKGVCVKTPDHQCRRLWNAGILFIYVLYLLYSLDSDSDPRPGNVPLCLSMLMQYPIYTVLYYTYFKVIYLLDPEANLTFFEAFFLFT